MESIKEIFKIGFGPSSSHTMGPQKAADDFRRKYPHADSYKVILYGSLAATGKGHFTDQIILKTLGDKKTSIEWRADDLLALHPNGMDFFAYQNQTEIGTWRVYS
ncbi:MAG: serine dehydratase, partial [Candidatus Cloacimonetes bacterium]|nr:serine dehydratase [Candidatus Cloacimonadota bacterium]